MIRKDLLRRGIRDSAVLRDMSRVPRHLFVSKKYQPLAYNDSPLPIAEGQTISQPFVVAWMTESARLSSKDRVLEIGTGSGYQAAVLAEIVQDVYTLEIVESLAREAKKRLDDLEYKNVRVRHGDGFRGWKTAGPFDAILITAATPEIPQPLIDQLKVGGRMILPLGPIDTVQALVRVTKTAQGLKEETLGGVRFVPMTGEVRE